MAVLPGGMSKNPIDSFDPSAHSITTVANIKGGVGKTTIAVLLAAELSRFSDVLLVDADEQRSALDFSLVRAQAHNGNAGYTTTELRGVAIKARIPLLAPKHQHVIIDCGGSDDMQGSLRNALRVSSRVLVPVRPRPADYWATTQFAALINGARSVNPKLTACAFLNQARVEQQRRNADTNKSLGDLEGIELLPVVLHDRTPFYDAPYAGMSLSEFDGGDTKAADEFRELIRLVFGIGEVVNHPKRQTA